MLSLPDAPTATCWSCPGTSAPTCTDSPGVAAVTSLYPEHLDWPGGEPSYYRRQAQPAGARPPGGRGQRARRALAAHLPGARAGPRRCRDRRPGRPGSYHLAPGPTARRGSTARVRRCSRGERLRLLGTGTTTATSCVALVHVDGARRGPGGAGAPSWPRRSPRSSRWSTGSPRSRTRPGCCSWTTRSPRSRRSAIHAIEAYADRPLTVLLGGNDRGVDYAPLRDFLAAAGDHRDA